MIGIKFRIETGYNNYLSKIFCSVDVSKFTWSIVSDDILCSNSNNGLFDADIVSGQSFLKSIAKENYHLIFADLKAFPIGSSNKEIFTFEEFIDSDCQIILLCVDSIFIDFFCKDELVLKIVYKNCIDNGFKDVESILSENCSGRSMIAF